MKGGEEGEHEKEKKIDKRGAQACCIELTRAARSSSSVYSHAPKILFAF
jgi:hypothetical protein